MKYERICTYDLCTVSNDGDYLRQRNGSADSGEFTGGN